MSGTWGPVCARALLGALAVAFVTLGAVRVHDGLQRRETPRWDARAFRVLRHGGDAVRGGETWVVPVNPGCPACLAMLARIAGRARSAAPRPRLVALLVDTPERRALDAAWRLGADAVAWDEDQVWRRRWGRRRYGEVLRFDASGALVAAGAAPRRDERMAAVHEPPREGR